MEMNVTKTRSKLTEYEFDSMIQQVMHDVYERRRWHMSVVLWAGVIQDDAPRTSHLQYFDCWVFNIEHSCSHYCLAFWRTRCLLENMLTCASCLDVPSLIPNRTNLITEVT